MKSLKSRKSFPIKKAVIPAAAIVILAGVGTYAYMSDTNPENSAEDATSQIETPEPAPSKLSDRDASAKQQYIEESTSDESSNDSAPTNESSDEASNEAPSNSSIEVSLNLSQENNSVIAKTSIRGATDGECTIIATNQSTGESTTQSAQVLFQSLYSTCEGFSIDKSTIGSGMWNVTLTIASGSKSKTITKSIGVT